ncbi:amidohydrolase family protein [Portibacter lacus]|uniref:Amidohydrolase n=1 Tax=Portibacter lacus TaxID=1099794 RepID=A0AA37WH72_9BACT|nr:amidohydrolase family protein [Portibacter lacus]GLR19049.1 amidohydrolase [Portibacter lacus]
MDKLKNIYALLIFIIVIPNSKAQTNNSESTAFTNITLIDVENSKSLENMTIIISDDKITSVFPSNSQQIPTSAEIVDMANHYIIPGLIDGHVHLFANQNRTADLEKLLFSGVTSLRDMGGDVRVYQELNQKIANGSIKSPNIYYSATFFGPEFLVDPRTKFANKGINAGEAPWMRVVHDSTNLKEVISEAKEFGVTGIKAYASISPDLLKVISEEAHRQGLKVWSHAAIFPSKPSDAVNAKVDAISHGVGMIVEQAETVPNSFHNAVRNFIPVQDFENADVLSQDYVDLLQSMKAEGTIFEPTISAWKKVQSKNQDGKMNENKISPKSNMPPAIKLNIPAMNKWVNNITNAAYLNGVTISAGTDFTRTIKWVQDEIRFLVESGLTEIDAIKAATLNNAIVIGIEKTHGSISVGKQADFVILTENPLENIENLRSVKTVYKNGKRYSVEE